MMGKQTEARANRIGWALVVGALAILLVLISLVPAISCIGRRFPGVYEWWTDGRAQLTVDCPESNTDYGGFGALSHGVAALVVPLWNSITYPVFGRAVLVLIVGGILVNVVWHSITRWLNKPV